jgi:hypothetical protein
MFKTLTLCRGAPATTAVKLGPAMQENGDSLRPIGKSCLAHGVGRRLPLWLKLAYTAFVAVLVP